MQRLLGCLLFAAALGCSTPGRDSASTERAALGVRTSAPSDELAAERGLTFNVRWEGRVVDGVEPGSAAEAAGIREGDVLLAIDGATLFSHDDITDFLSVSRPGQQASIRLARAGDAEPEEVRVTLGRAAAAPADAPRLRWEFAGPVQLERALATARAEKKKVMVGLSGAET